jgi:hypothetical protein
MKDSMARKTLSKNEKTKDPRTVQRFLEELSWVLSTYSNLDFKSIVNPQPASASAIRGKAGFQRYISNNPNVHFLVGALPTIFSDEKLFASNQDIADFASEALSLPISRWEKRSRYELIGLIVCETTKLDDVRLSRLVDALSNLIGDDAKVKNLSELRRAGGMSWNDLIQKLSRETSE